jgi:predicted DNA binding CopG/RHH family protein
MPLFGTLAILLFRSLPMPVLKTLVGPLLKTRFQSLASAQGLSESELLRQVVLNSLGENGSTVAPVDPDPKKSDTKRMTIRLARFLTEAVKLRAKSKSMAPSRWISALVQSNILKQPVMGDIELQGLRTSNRELAAIGRNINQIAKALNETFHERERVRLDRLAELGRAIEGNRLAIQSLVRASQNTWETAR